MKRLALRTDDETSQSTTRLSRFRLRCFQCSSSGTPKVAIELRMVRAEPLVKPGWADRFHDAMKRKKAEKK